MAAFTIKDHGYKEPLTDRQKRVVERIRNGTDFHVFYSETEVGPVTKQLYDELVGIQFGDKEAPEGWIVKA